MIKRKLITALKYSDNYCNTLINKFYDPPTEPFDPDRHVDVTPDVLVVLKGALTICKNLQQALQMETVVKTMISGVGRHVTPFQFCFGNIKTDHVLSNAAKPNTPTSILDKTPKDNLMIDAATLTQALLFFTRTCFLLHDLQSIAVANTNQLTSYCNNCVVFVLNTASQFIPQVPNSMFVYNNMPADHRVRQEVYQSLIDMTYGLYNLAVTAARTLKLNTGHEQNVMLKNIEKYAQLREKQSIVLEHAEKLINKYSAIYCSCIDPFICLH
nr:ORF39 [Acipenserid herpesvirus 1]